MYKFILIVKIYCRKGGIQLYAYLTLVTKTLMSLDLHELLSLQERAYVALIIVYKKKIVILQHDYCTRKMYILLDATKIENVCFEKKGIHSFFIYFSMVSYFCSRFEAYI